MYALRLPYRLALAVCLAATVSISVSAAPSSNRGETAPKVHLICIGDSGVGDIGNNVADDARNTIAAFEQAFNQADRGHLLNKILILGEDVTATKILERIRTLDVRPQDTVVLLYSGHGGTDLQNRHRLSFHLDDVDMYRDDLLAALKAKNARLTILLTDVCSGYGKHSPRIPTPSVSETQPRHLPTGLGIEWRTIECLFLSHSGLVDITAAEPGYNARVNRFGPGSHFTNALLKILKVPHQSLVSGLDRDGDGAVQWDELLPQVRGEAAELDRPQTRGRPQQTYAWSLGRWTPVTTQTRR